MNNSVARSILQLDHKQVATAGDIFSVLQAAYAIEASLVRIKNFPPLTRTIQQIMHSPNMFWGVIEQQQLLGFIEVENFLVSANNIVISSLCVDPQFFKRGLASQLLSFVLTNCQSAAVSTATKNLPAINLYKKLGFVVTHTTNNQQGIALTHFLYKVYSD